MMVKSWVFANLGFRAILAVLTTLGCEFTTGPVILQCVCASRLCLGQTSLARRHGDAHAGGLPAVLT